MAAPRRKQWIQRAKIGSDFGPFAMRFGGLIRTKNATKKVGISIPPAL
jgi:hypothetical protein